MSADDIAQEQHKLQGSLDSKILAFLKKRSKCKKCIIVFVMRYILFILTSRLV